MAIIILILKIYLFLLNIFCVQSDRKIWNPKETKTWIYYGNKLCADKTIVFPDFQRSVFRLSENLEINQLVLPTNGIILFNKNITFSDLQPECNLNENYKYKAIVNEPWFLTENWKIEDDNKSVQRKENNAAVPHMDRIPCECDTVIFPNSKTSAVDLTLVNELVLGKIVLDNTEQDDFDSFLKTELGQFMFPTASLDAVTFIPGVCNPQTFCGCHSYRQFFAYKEILCLNEICPIPKCVDPIKPLGHCCAICGATWLYELKDSCNFEIEKLYHIVARNIKQYGNGKFMNLIDFYAGIIPGKNENAFNILQLIVVDRNELYDNSIEFMQMLTQNITFKGPNIKTFYSGMPYDPTKSSSSWLIIFVTLCFVIGFFGILYVHYVEEKSLIPNWITLPKLSKISSPFVFARFENAGNDDGDTDRIDVGVEFSTDIITDESLGGEGSATGFNNPLFTKVSAVEKIETTETTSVEEIQHNEIDENNCESEKLVEIALDDTQDIM